MVSFPARGELFRLDPPNDGIPWRFGRLDPDDCMTCDLIVVIETDAKKVPISFVSERIRFVEDLEAPMRLFYFPGIGHGTFQFEIVRGHSQISNHLTSCCDPISNESGGFVGNDDT
ncbi:MAG: hypothetical protein JWN25_61 [Verrucomicrobiales bacterium]|nr:hypothetical protein [Verrucomicrobiales bacterium]